MRFGISELTEQKSNVHACGLLLQTFANRMLGVMNFVIPLGVALSAFGCSLSIQFSVTRLCYVAAREGHMVEALSYIHVRRLTPAPAVILQVSDTLQGCSVRLFS